LGRDRVGVDNGNNGRRIGFKTNRRKTAFLTGC
jgi:hypothetical protein